MIVSTIAGNLIRAPLIAPNPATFVAAAVGVFILAVAYKATTSGDLEHVRVNKDGCDIKFK